MHETSAEPNFQLRLEPEGARWPAIVRRPPTDPTTVATRHALGLATEHPVIMGGHQPGLWHMGIVAKWLAIGAAAERTGGVGAWVVVDQSPGATLEYPARRGQGLARGAIRLGDPDAPPAAQKPATFEPPTDAASEGVSRGLTRISTLLASRAREPTLARQLHSACADALGGDLLSFFATDLHTTAAFAELIGAIRADPGACARLYNEAARAQPGAGVRELAIEGSGAELPLWERTGEPDRPTPWRRVTSDRLPDLPDHRIVLRGLPTTGLLRRWACDLFVHGTGGGGEDGYDSVTERWFESWLGAELAPAAVATATVRLDLGAADLPTPEEIEAARLAAHRAEHDPSLLGEAELGRRKRELAERIASLDRGDPQRAELFRQMQTLRTGAAAAHAGDLAALRARADALAARADEAAIAADRTWSFLFHPPGVLEAMRREVGAKIG